MMFFTSVCHASDSDRSMYSINSRWSIKAVVFGAFPNEWNCYNSSYNKPDLCLDVNAMFINLCWTIILKYKTQQTLQYSILNTIPNTQYNAQYSIFNEIPNTQCNIQYLIQCPIFNTQWNTQYSMQYTILNTIHNTQYSASFFVRSTNWLSSNQSSDTKLCSIKPQTWWGSFK